MKLKVGIAAVSAFLLLTSAAPARADVVLTPYIGSLFGGDLPNNKAAYGLSAAFMGGGVFGAEAGFNYTPSFVPETLTSPQVAQASLMGNLILGIPMGGDSASVRPYVTGGAGLFRATAKKSDFFDRINAENDFAVNFGGGVMAFFSDHVGLRGDLRYFRTLTNKAESGLDFDLGDLNFWKWDVGAAFKF